MARDRRERLRRFWMVAPLLAAASPGFAADSVAIVSLSARGNFHAGGVTLTVSGDDNRNATAALEWRLAGQPTFRAALPLARADATRLAGSLFSLAPGRAYDVRVTLSDPDGVTGPATATAVLATRADVQPEPTLRTLYVSPAGNDGNPGTSPGAPVRTIQRAADLAQAGDLVQIAAGVYRETVTVPRSGTATQPIVFRGSPGAILDGADGAIAGGVPWSAVGGGVFSRLTGFPTDHVVSNAGRLFRYSSLAALGALAAGPPGGFFFDGTTLFVKFTDGSSPAAHTMQVARHEVGFLLDGRAYVRVEGLEIRHYGITNYGKGVYLRYSSDCAVRSCRIHEVEAAGVWIKGGDRNLVEDNEVWDTSIFGWDWNETKGSSAENDGVVFTNEIGVGNVVRRNYVHGTFNGIGPCGSLPPPAGFANETDVYDNFLAQHTDDALEPEGWCSNVRMWNNRIQDVHMAFAVAPAAPGPTYIVRNVAWRFGNTRTSQQDGYTASALKINSGFPDPIGPLFLLHNTFVTDAPATEALALLNPGFSTVIRARNNVFASTRYVLEKVNPAVLDLNGDLLFTTDPARFVRWEGVPYANLAALRSGTGQELLGLQAAPLLVAPTGQNFQPQPPSPLVDHALPLPGINDLFRGAGPDVGAFEVGSGFLDVPTSNAVYPWVEALVRRGVTGGCSVTPPLYCPNTSVTREQMAVFLLRAREGESYTPPPCATPPFADVPCSSPFAPWIAELLARGTTSGCGGGNYCPAGLVPREQMAVFLLRTLLGSSYLPPACTTAVFADVPCSSPFARWVNDLAARGIAGGCGGGNFCPSTAVTRGQMAVFLGVTFSLQ
jgi:parallel beta-helix repeat protein